jgi:Tol biopolymer transport system component
MIRGSNENHDIQVINDTLRPLESLKALTTWQYDDIRPVWSPDGKHIAFYSNYNAAGDPKIWSILVVAADGSDPGDGEGLAAKVMAADVIPDVERGPAWMPDSNRIVYVKNDRQEYNPLYVVSIKDRTNAPMKTDTKMNHDVSCSAAGVLAFRAQVSQWDQIFVAKLKE